MKIEQRYLGNSYLTENPEWDRQDTSWKSALQILKDSGFNIIKWEYTGASLNAPNQSPEIILAQIPRRLAYCLNREWGVRLLGGETLIIIATA